MHHMDTNVPQIEDVAGIDLRHLFAHVVQNRWWILASIVTFSAAFSAYAFLATPMYRVTAVLMPAATTRNMDAGGAALHALASLPHGLGIGGAGNSHIEEALAVLRSRAFTEKFIADKRLLPKLFPKKWNSSNQKWDVPPDEEPTLSQGYTYFNKKIRTVTLDHRTGLITLRVEWKNPAVAADWATELVARLNQQMRARAIAKAEASLKFLTSQLQRTSMVEMRNALGFLMEVQLKKRMIAQVTPNYALQFVAPPIGSDGARPVWPKKLLLLLLGPAVGLMFGVLSAIFWGSIRDSQ